MRQHIERALEWIDTNSEGANNGYLSYQSKSKRGLGNQGWKDSGDAIMNADGSRAIPPIALVEVQGYVYRAKCLIADLYARSGDNGTASKLRKEADDLKSRLNLDFWVPSKHFYAIALQDKNRPAAVISSNPGQALWAGIIEQSRIETVVQHLRSPQMFSGWGRRTLSEKEHRFNPSGYHLGTVWPHDTSLIASGFCRYGFGQDAVRVLNGLLQAARHFEHYRPPELLGGFSKKQCHIPVRYPVACHPQAWAAGSVPFLLVNLLGLTPDAFGGCLRVIRPVLPKSVHKLEFRRIKVGKGSVDLRFDRTEGDYIAVDVMNATHGVKVEVER